MIDWEVGDLVEDECVGCEGGSTREVFTVCLLFLEARPELEYKYSLRAD